ncbi:MAG TPA: M14 family zinc carboxypeptidase [Candidatus Thermoplasmatota archaeon]|nr:M14 family zinc carboxypeptidase [Candidatus Thermoplasmatota archaeon]
MLRALPAFLAALLLLGAAPLASAHAGPEDAIPALPEGAKAPLYGGFALTGPARTVHELAALSSLIVGGKPVEGDERDWAFEGGTQFVRRNLDVERELKTMAAAKPDLVKVERHGTSAGGLPIWRGEFTNSKAEGPKYGVYLDGSHHGNEYLGGELVMVFAYYLFQGYGVDEEVTKLLDTHVVYVTPIINPDGNTLDTRKNANLVDVNRNYPYEWGGEGAGTDPTSFTYRGPSAASEPETQAQLAFAASHKIDLWVTMHTGVAEMYWPWSYTHDPTPDNDFFTSLEKPFEEASGGTLDAMQSAELYIAAGDTEDFAYGTYGIPAFVIEVHPDQFRPVYVEGTDSVIVGQFNALKWLVMNTEKLGANVHVHDHEGQGITLGADSATFWLHNKGFANATNVSLVLKAGEQVLAQRVVDIPAGGHMNLTFGGLPTVEGLRLEGSYRELQWRAAENKTLSYDVASLDPASTPATIPAIPLLGTALAVALVAALGRRRAA